jgi:hypothetical protein
VNLEELLQRVTARHRALGAVGSASASTTSADTSGYWYPPGAERPRRGTRSITVALGGWGPSRGHPRETF